jgi:NADH dehydrogenase (ubiquinone) 1 beta subcomplex subunit 8
MLSRRAVTMLRSPVARVAQVQVRGIRASFDKAEEPMVSMGS